jgi:hypothetical protein
MQALALPHSSTFITSVQVAALEAKAGSLETLATHLQLCIKEPLSVQQPCHQEQGFESYGACSHDDAMEIGTLDSSWIDNQSARRMCLSAQAEPRPSSDVLANNPHKRIALAPSSRRT